MCGDGVSQATSVFNAAERGDDFGRDFFVQLDVLLKLRKHRAAQGFQFMPGTAHVHHVFHARQKRAAAARIINSMNARARTAFHQHLDGAIGQFQHLQDAGRAADLIHVVRPGVFLGDVFLGDEQDGFVRSGSQFQRLDGARTPHKQGDDHVREDNNVAQRQHRQLLEQVNINRGSNSHFVLSQARRCLRWGGDSQISSQRRRWLIFCRKPWIFRAARRTE